MLNVSAKAWATVCALCDADSVPRVRIGPGRIYAAYSPLGAGKLRVTYQFPPSFSRR
jgi:hypothetical protein